jgi:hypothetical protein
MLIGAGINTIKGATDAILNKNSLKMLENIKESAILELIPEEKHLTSNILLKCFLRLKSYQVIRYKMEILMKIKEIETTDSVSLRQAGGSNDRISLS